MTRKIQQFGIQNGLEEEKKSGRVLLVISMKPTGVNPVFLPFYYQKKSPQGVREDKHITTFQQQDKDPLVLAEP